MHPSHILTLAALTGTALSKSRTCHGQRLYCGSSLSNMGTPPPACPLSFVLLPPPSPPPSPSPPSISPSFSPHTYNFKHCQSDTLKAGPPTQSGPASKRVSKTTPTG